MLIICPRLLSAASRGEANGSGAGAGSLALRPPAAGRAETGEAGGEAARLIEARHLVRALGLQATACLHPRPARPSAATLLPSGQCAAAAARLSAEPAELLFVDAALSPGQQRNLEDRLGVKVLDRTGLILEIFALRAQSREGRLQVSLAQLAWQRSRLVRSWTHLERQRGGTAKAAGPGERQLELDRRMLDRKLQSARRELAKVRRVRGEQRRGAGGAHHDRRLGRLQQRGQVLALQCAHRGAGCGGRRRGSERGSSTRSIRWPAPSPWRRPCPAGGGRCSPTPSASCATCRTGWSPPSVRPWRSCATPTSCSMSKMPAHRRGRAKRRRWSRLSQRSSPGPVCRR